jgi:rhodanese-related sulfurtransferase
MKKIMIIIISLGAVFFNFMDISCAVTPQQLGEMLKRGDKITIIDIRNTELYAQGHIQEAINIPTSIIAKKRLPPFGAVVVYGDGIRMDLTQDAANDLNRKKGIKAEILEGGYAAWEAVSLPTTRKSGLGKSKIQYISYQELEKTAAENPDIILVDLRVGPLRKKIHRGTISQEEQPVTELSKEFSGFQTIKLSQKSRARKKKWDIASQIFKKEQVDPHRNLYVLIDNCDGESEKVARRLMAAGVKRVAILTGGELSLRRKGKSMVMRKEMRYE